MPKHKVFVADTLLSTDHKYFYSKYTLASTQLYYFSTFFFCKNNIKLFKKPKELKCSVLNDVLVIMIIKHY